MLNREALAELHRTWRQEKVLSVYLDGRAHDFSERKLWRKRFDQEVGESRRRLNGTAPEEVEAFDAALQHIEEALQQFDQFLPDRGWVGFATPDQLVQGQSVRVPMPDLVRWEGGLRVAPYVRALKQDRPVIGALVDSRRARVFEYRDGTMEEIKDVFMDATTEDLASINVSKRATSHSGVRGKTATDAYQRSAEVESERLVKRVVEFLAERAGTEGLVVVGGTPEASSATLQHLPSGVRSRALERNSSSVEMSDGDVQEMLEGAASEVNQALQEELLSEVLDQAHSGGKGALGPRDVEQALTEARVDTLLLSRAFIGANGDYADRLVGMAFEQGAEVEELSQEGGERLDGEGEGVAARLRYTLQH